MPIKGLGQRALGLSVLIFQALLGIGCDLFPGGGTPSGGEGDGQAPSLALSHPGGAYEDEIQLKVLNLAELQAKYAAFDRLTYTTNGSPPAFGGALFPLSGIAVSADATIKITGWKPDGSALFARSEAYTFNLAGVPRSFRGNYLFAEGYRLVVSRDAIKVQDRPYAEWTDRVGESYPITVISPTTFSISSNNSMRASDFEFVEGGNILRYKIEGTKLGIAVRSSPAESRTRLRVMRLSEDSPSARFLSLGGLGGIRILVKNLKNAGDVREYMTDAAGDVVAPGLPGGDDVEISPLPDAAHPGFVSAPAIVSIPEGIADYDAGIVTQTQNSESGNLRIIFDPSSYNDWRGLSASSYLVAGTMRKGMTYQIQNIGGAATGNLRTELVAPAGMSIDNADPASGPLQAAGVAGDRDIFSFFASFDAQAEDYVDRSILVRVTDEASAPGTPPFEGRITLRVYRETFALNTTWVNKIFVQAPSGETVFQSYSLGKKTMLLPKLQGRWNILVSTSESTARPYSIGLAAESMNSNAISNAIPTYTNLGEAFEPNESLSEAREIPFSGAMAASVSPSDLDSYYFVVKPIVAPPAALTLASSATTDSNILDASGPKPILVASKQWASATGSPTSFTAILYAEGSPGNWSSYALPQAPPPGQGIADIASASDGRVSLFYFELVQDPVYWTAYYYPRVATWKDGSFDMSPKMNDRIYAYAGKLAPFGEGSAIYRDGIALLFLTHNDATIRSVAWDGTSWTTSEAILTNYSGMDLWRKADGSPAIVAHPWSAGSASELWIPGTGSTWTKSASLTSSTFDYQAGNFDLEGDPLFAYLTNSNPDSLILKRGNSIIAAIPGEFANETWQAADGAIYLVGRYEYAAGPSTQGTKLRLYRIGESAYEMRPLTEGIVGRNYATGVDADGRLHVAYQNGTVLKVLSADPAALFE